METSFFKSYYSTLPSTLRNMPIFWSEDELSWLKGSYIIQQIQERKAAIRKDYDVICRVRWPFRRFCCCCVRNERVLTLLLCV